jgi:multiple sugar transport system ATP-binding protein
MDEPLSNLDAKLRVQMRAEVSRLQHRLGTTTVYVTHDQTEAMTLGDRVAVMRAGVLQQVDVPNELYNNPVNIFVAGFIGSPSMNFFAATVEGDRLKLPFAEVPLSGDLRQAAGSADGALIAGVRPEQFYDPAIETGASGTEFEVPIELVESLGAEVYVHFATGAGGAESEELAELAQDSGAADVPSAGEGMAVARLEPGTRARAGQRARLGIHPQAIHIFDARSGRNLALAKAPAAAGDGGGTGDAEPAGDQPSSTRLS